MGTIEQYYIEHITACLKSAGEDTKLLRNRIKTAAQNRLDKLNKILKDGLDIGGIVEHRIKVSLVNNLEHGWCFNGGKRYGLYPILDHT